MQENISNDTAKNVRNYEMFQNGSQIWSLPSSDLPPPIVLSDSSLPDGIEPLPPIKVNSRSWLPKDFDLWLYLGISLAGSAAGIIHSVALVFFLANFFIFGVLMLYSCCKKISYSDLLYKVGALYSPDIRYRGHFHRLLIPIILHMDVIHLAFNTYGHYLSCFPFEKRLAGQNWFLLIYVVSGLCGNLLSACVNVRSLGVGASTSLFGILGAMEVNSRFAPRPVFLPQPFSYWVAIIVFHLYLLLGGQKFLRIDPWGHLGGFICGALFSFGLFIRIEVFIAIPLLFIGLTIIFYKRQIPRRQRF